MKVGHSILERDYIMVTEGLAGKSWSLGIVRKLLEVIQIIQVLVEGCALW